MHSTESAAYTGYTATAKWLHWLIVGLLTGQFAIAWAMPHIGRDTKAEGLVSLHFSIGIVILIVAFLRFGWKVTHTEPSPEDGVPPWQSASAQILHWALYLLLFVIPVLGWMNASYRGLVVKPFGLLELPSLVAKRAPGFAWTGDVHSLLAYYVMLGLISLHVLAALYHYFVQKDGVLQRMLPRLRL